MNAKMLFGFLFLVSIVAHSQGSRAFELFKSPMKNNFALNVPENMLLGKDRILKYNLLDNDLKEEPVPEKNTNGMPVFEPSSKHNTPNFPIDATRTHYIRIYHSKGTEQ